MYAEQAAAAEGSPDMSAGPDAGEQQQGNTADDVVDAEFEEVKDDKK